MREQEQGDSQCASIINAVRKRERYWASSALPLRCFGVAPKAETHVYLLRGWFGVFSTGLDKLAEELRSKGIKAEAVGHLAWKSTVSEIVKYHSADKSGSLVLVGHSQGANTCSDYPKYIKQYYEFPEFCRKLYEALLLGNMSDHRNPPQVRPQSTLGQERAMKQLQKEKRIREAKWRDGERGPLKEGWQAIPER